MLNIDAENDTKFYKNEIQLAGYFCVAGYAVLGQI